MSLFSLRLNCWIDTSSRKAWEHRFYYGLYPNFLANCTNSRCQSHHCSIVRLTISVEED